MAACLRLRYEFMNSIAAAELLAIAAAIHFPSAKFYCQFANADVVSAAGIATASP
jgi:hypothetical protein